MGSCSYKVKVECTTKPLANASALNARLPVEDLQIEYRQPNTT